MPESVHPLRHGDAEVVLLHETQRFMRVTARSLQRLPTSSRMLRRRLARTQAYRRVDGLDEAQSEPIWDLAATLEVLLEDDLVRMIEYLRSGARQAGVAAERRS